MIKNKWYVILPAIYVAISYFLILVLDQETTAFLTAEDHFFESLTATGLLLTSILFLLIGVYLFRRKAPVPFLQKLFYLGLAFLFFFGAGEEIAWGQRIFKYDLPTIVARNNAQGDMTVHNLYFFEGNVTFGFGELFGLGTLILTFVIPLSAYFVVQLKRFYEKFLPIFPWIFGVLMGFTWGIAKLEGMLTRSDFNASFTVNNITEVKESGYAVVYVVLALYMYVLIVKSAPGEVSIPESTTAE